MGLDPWDPNDFPYIFYHWLIVHNVRPRIAKWLSHPRTSMCEWLYWRNILMLPWEGEGWKLNTRKNRDKRRIRMLGDRFNSANF
jgi:hypothetical protein